IPICFDLELFREICKIGSNLVSIQLFESTMLIDTTITKVVGTVSVEVEKISYSDKTVWLDKKQKNGFQGVTDQVWNFHIGGYQVCHKWLKDRKGRLLSDDDIDHYQKIIVAISETIRLMTEIDTVIDAHGGWPAAFQAKSGETK
ncbi:MAG: DNA methyltransferase, partial [Proteobacteria bacterium]|nr:DNA methyltransferase [Pseudomonadota bacterium]